MRIFEFRSKAVEIFFPSKRDLLYLKLPFLFFFIVIIVTSRYDEKCELIEAQANIDAYLGNPNDWAYARMAVREFWDGL